jgi:UDP-N-acetylmuramate--alanine ligase
MRLLEKKKVTGQLGCIHFIGIGGIGMSGIAKIMHTLGYKVQGSDLSSNLSTIGLKQLGIEVFDSHDRANLQNAKYVVVSSAIKANNIELIEANRLGLQIIPRAEMLAEIMRFKTCIAISGSHGKTTTTSMIAHIFEAAGINPTVINGGVINNKDTNAYTGCSDFLITEADESDATFIRVPATIGVITNIDSEHLDFYGSFDNLLEAFRQFILNIPFYGFVVACADHTNVKNLTNKITTKKIITYGINSLDANVQAFNIRMSGFDSVFDVKICSHRDDLGDILIHNIYLSVPGTHNILNSLAAIAIAIEMDFGPRIIQEAFKTFGGVKRRFCKVGQYKDITIIDDYAHHPEEIKATIKAARHLADLNQAQLIVVCQPHRYSRVTSLSDEFARCFDLADKVYVSKIYSAGEENHTKIDQFLLAQKINHSDVHPLASIDDLPQIILNVQCKSIVLMMGAGDITYYAQNLQDDLRNLASLKNG